MGSAAVRGFIREQPSNSIAPVVKKTRECGNQTSSRELLHNNGAAARSEADKQHRKKKKRTTLGKL